MKIHDLQQEVNLASSTNELPAEIISGVDSLWEQHARYPAVKMMTFMTLLVRPFLNPNCYDILFLIYIFFEIYLMV